ncbi:GMC family oxidoreductase [Pseudonocardia halophobica]|uniref:GMC family oxidoreductase n=1 Tax=Pseudonocardia halophobica TaxID=29401 RepID=UPI003D8D3106
MTEGRYDYVIVGAGSAGCVVAARLSADPAVSVLLLEAGSTDNSPDLTVPVKAPSFLGSAYDWDFRSEPEPGLGGRVMTLNHGRVLGGSSSINSMVYLRGAAADYDEWAAAGATGWSYAEVLPYFRRCEDNDRGADDFHGAGGPLAVSDGRSRHPLSAAFLEAAQQAGYPLNEDMNGATQEGVGFTQVTQRDGRRWSTATGYLRPNRGRPNLTVLTDSPVSDLLFEGSRAVGVRVDRDGGPTDYRADAEIVVCAGAYGSPQMLMLAGIGPATHLTALGVPVRADLPVGLNLQDHLRSGLCYESTLPSLQRSLTDEALALYEAEGRGPISSNVGETAGFIRSSPAVAEPNWHVNGVPAMIGGMIGIAGDGVSVIGWPSKPTSCGYLELRDTDPSTPPRIVHNYLMTGYDRRTTCDGMRRMREITEQPAFKAVSTGRLLLGPEGYDDPSILRFVRQTGVTTHHPCGTCAIGEVVDPELRVYGIEGLRVADASVLPSVTRSNTNAPTIMVGEKAADLLLAARATAPAAVVSA